MASVLDAMDFTGSPKSTAHDRSDFYAFQTVQTENSSFIVNELESPSTARNIPLGFERGYASQVAHGHLIAKDEDRDYSSISHEVPA